MNNGVNIQYEPLREKLLEIENDIVTIETILKEVDKANISLDDGSWKSTEKTKMDQEYIPYITRVATNAPMELKKRLNYIRKSVNIYETLEENLTQKANDQLEDII